MVVIYVIMGQRILKETRLFWRYLRLAVRMRMVYITDLTWGLLWQIKKHREGNAPTIKIPMEFTWFVDAVSCDYKSQTHHSDTQQKVVLQVTSFTIIHCVSPWCFTRFVIFVARHLVVSARPSGSLGVGGRREWWERGWGAICIYLHDLHAKNAWETPKFDPISRHNHIWSHFFFAYMNWICVRVNKTHQSVATG